MTPIFWTERLHFGPGARMAHAMAYDAARQRVVLFGGIDQGGSLADTWAWDGAYWTQVADTGPGARSGHGMAYDPVHRLVVLFGGMGAKELGDTWVWDGAAWTQVAETGPPARSDHAMASDDARARIVLFGGTGANDLGDTWEWDGIAWTKREDTGPAPRRGHSMAYDQASARVVLFGGATQQTVLDDTWEWSGTAWRQLAEFGAPAGLHAALSHDGRGTVLLGGVGSTAAGEAGRVSTWEWDGRFWTEIQHFGPPGRTGHAMSYDAGRRRVVVFGGARESGPPAAGALLGDTWECPAREPLLVSVTVSPADVRQGGSLTVAVRLSGSAGEGVQVQLAASLTGQPANLDLPSTLTVAAGHDDGSATVVVPVTAQTGAYTVTASASGISRSAPLAVSQAAPPGSLRLAAVLPNPDGDEVQNEQVTIRNGSTTTEALAGWQVANPNGQNWLLDNGDGLVPALQTTVITRRGRPMALVNSGGTIILINPAGLPVDTRVYGPALPGQVIQFD